MSKITSLFVIGTRTIYYLDGAAIRHHRISKRWSIRGFAKRIGVSSSLIARIETGENISVGPRILELLQQELWDA